jgi:hypothetical protein
MTECNQCAVYADETSDLIFNLNHLEARYEKQVDIVKEMERRLQAPFAAAHVRALQLWLGVTGSIMTDESWDKLNESTRRLYVLEVVKLACE